MTPHDIVLPGSTKSSEPFKECSKCGVRKDPKGGIEMTPGKWRCATCWRGFALRK
jgi:hypothetical protein